MAVLTDAQKLTVEYYKQQYHYEQLSYKIWELLTEDVKLAEFGSAQKQALEKQVAKHYGHYEYHREALEPLTNELKRLGIFEETDAAAKKQHPDSRIQDQAQSVRDGIIKNIDQQFPESRRRGNQSHGGRAGEPPKNERTNREERRERSPRKVLSLDLGDLLDSLPFSDVAADSLPSLQALPAQAVNVLLSSITASR